MAIRMSGLISGLDTEAIIKELMSVQSMKLTKKENLKTKTEWKQEKWKDLNTKLYSLYTGPLSKVRAQGNYATKKVNSSNENMVSATATSSAAVGSHTLEVKSLASAQYVTSAQITKDNFNSNASSKSISTKTKLMDLKGFSEGTVINIENNGKKKKLEVSENTTIEDFITTCRGANLNANFDETQKRFFISSKTSGDGKGFQIYTGNGSEDSATVSSRVLTKLQNEVYSLINYDEMDDAAQTMMDYYFESFDLSMFTNMAATKKTYEDFLKKYEEMDEQGKADNAEKLNGYKTAYDEAFAEYEADKPNQKAKLDDMFDTARTLALNYNGEAYTATQIDEKITSLSNSFWETLDSGTDITITTGDPVLASLGLDEITGESVSSESGFTVQAAANAKIVLDGAEITVADNTVTVNGLTLDLKSVTEGTVTLSVVTDVDQVYNSIKDFIKNYNEVLKEMNEAYNAKSARKYDVLTSEQKEAMTDEEVEKWEGKIKDSLLRRDNTLSTLLSVMKNSMNTSVKLDSVTFEAIDTTKKDSDGNPIQYNSPVSYSLSSFGIVTSSDYTEGSLLHIKGDEDDELYSGEDNLLKKALEENPAAVQSVLSKLCSNLYDKLTEKMASSSISSAMTFYNDKELKSQISDYEDDLKTLQKKLNEQEDRYYRQFTAMEKAMSQSQSQSSALSSMLGIGG